MALAARSLKLPKFILYTFYILSLIDRFITWVSTTLGISSLPMDSSSSSSSSSSSDVSLLHDPIKQAQSADLIRKMLPVVKFEDLVSNTMENDNRVCTQERCAVCLCEFDNKDEIRPLMDCRHIFHRSCLDGWIDHDHRTCPLCRTPFIPTRTQEAVKRSTSIMMSVS